MTVLAVLTALAVLVNSLPSFCWSYKIRNQEATVTVLAVLAVSVVTATPLKLNSTPLFRHPDVSDECHFYQKPALQQAAKSCIARLIKLRCRKVALSCCLPADFRLPRLGPADDKGRPNHDHDQFLVHLAAPDFSILGYPWMSHQMPFPHSGTQRKRKDVTFDVSSTAVLVRLQMQNFWIILIVVVDGPSLSKSAGGGGNRELAGAICLKPLFY